MHLVEHKTGRTVMEHAMLSGSEKALIECFGRVDSINELSASCQATLIRRHRFTGAVRVRVPVWVPGSGSGSAPSPGGVWVRVKSGCGVRVWVHDGREGPRRVRTKRREKSNSCTDHTTGGHFAQCTWNLKASGSVHHLHHHDLAKCVCLARLPAQSLIRIL